MLAKNFSNLTSNSYKVLCFIQHRFLIDKNVYNPMLNELDWNNKIKLFPNLNSLMTAKTEKIKFKSIVIYKFDNKKISGIEYDKDNNVFTTNHIDNKAIIKYKKINFDSNRINEYYRNLYDLEKYFERN